MVLKVWSTMHSAFMKKCKILVRVISYIMLINTTESLLFDQNSKIRCRTFQFHNFRLPFEFLTLTFCWKVIVNNLPFICQFFQISKHVSTLTEYTVCKDQLIFEMSFCCLQNDQELETQKPYEIFARISALPSKKKSDKKGTLYH